MITSKRTRRSSQPDYRRNEVLGFLKNNTLEDLCISRPAARLNWGIPLPFDQDFVTYVWFDALVNYISIPAAHGDPAVLAALSSELRTPNPELELWPADIHVIGKDIVKFHAVYWPIMLKAMGLPLPKQVLVHGWWQKDGAKMSKSTGNVVDPVAVIDEWGLDAFRFYVLRELDIGPDGNWTDAGFKARYQAELANGLGNLVNRSLSMLKRYRNGVVPAKHDELAADAEKAADETRALLEQNQLQAALQSIWSLVTRANQYVDQTAPFKLAKDPAQGRAARRSALQPGRNLPGAGGFALAVPARHGGEDLRATRLDRCAGQARRRDLGRPAGRPHHRRAGAAVPAQRNLMATKLSPHEPSPMVVQIFVPGGTKFRQRQSMTWMRDKTITEVAHEPLPRARTPVWEPAQMAVRARGRYRSTVTMRRFCDR